jgi:DNA-binding HxlR family transcriptional regulator
MVPAPKNLDYLDCSIANTLELIGDRWSLLILRDAFMGVRRFEDFHNDLGIARNILSARLDRLIAGGILETRRYQDHPSRDEYVLTASGKDLFDVLLAMWRWGDRWAPPPEAELRELFHTQCGEVTQMVPACQHCGGELRRSELRIRPGLAVVDAGDRSEVEVG